jgi:hypothetical protein
VRRALSGRLGKAEKIMMTTHERLDALIKVARERVAEGRSFKEFEQLYYRLRHLANPQEALEVEVKWNNFLKEVEVASWDEDFLKAISGENQEERHNNLFDANSYYNSNKSSGAYSISTSAAGGTLNPSPGSIQMSNKALVDEIIKIQKEQELAEKVKAEWERTRLANANSNS